MAREIFDSYRVSAHGGFAYVRSRPGEGQCSHGYPCTHVGLDCYPTDLDEYAKAPEALRVLKVATNNETPPLSGYGPGAVWAVSDGLPARLAGLWRRWHVFGHLRAEDVGRLRVGQSLAEGESIGRVYAPSSGRYRHCHWELRTAASVPGGAARMPFVRDPRQWVREVNLALATLAAAGAVTLSRLG